MDTDLGTLAPITMEEAVSLPALGALLRQAEKSLRDVRRSDQYEMLLGAARTMGQMDQSSAYPNANLLGRLAPMYEIRSGDLAREVRAADHVIRQVTDRLYRLAAAYGEWDEFDVEAYFDCTEEQTQRLICIEEQEGALQITFFADLLMPSYQTALIYFYDQWLPAYYLLWDRLYGRRSLAKIDSRFANEVQPQMVAHWQQVTAVIQQTRDQLYDDIGFLTMSAGYEERERWQPYWNTSSTTGLSHLLQPELEDVPTLTLVSNFPLPTAQQEGRQERLRRNRNYGRKTLSLNRDKMPSDTSRW